MSRNLTDDEITKLLTDWESQEEELLEDVVGSVDCESEVINNNKSDQLQIAIAFSIIDKYSNYSSISELLTNIRIIDEYLRFCTLIFMNGFIAQYASHDIHLF